LLPASESSHIRSFHSWNSVAFVLCGDFGSALATTAVLVAAIGALMLIASPLKHKINDIYKSEKKESGKAV